MILYSLFFFFFFFSFLFFFFLGIYFLWGFSYFVELFMTYSDYLDFSFVFLFDYVSLFFFSFVSLISSVVFLYSKFYMADYILQLDLNNSRFFFLLFLFVISMFFLVFSGSWIVTLFGWDGLGLVSFLLVVYYNDSSSLGSGLLTVFTNRVGDSFFILSFFLFYFNGWMFFDFLNLFSSFFFLFIISMGCFTKSAQIPFSSWLPAAMAAPTPVSSLVHSSTLVTAGVYLFIRFNYLFYSFFFFISFVSLFTMLLSGFCAIYEKDMKKVVAMSTLSQLGFMIFSISMGCWLISFLHMMFHAIFKSSLFLATGNMMNFLLGDQDSRFFGSLGSSYFSKLFYLTSCICLMGFPFSLGFYSKDIIIGSIMSYFHNVYFVMFFLSCIFTVSYSFRLVFNGFFFFPSFNTFTGFKEKSYFFFPVVIIYFFCVFLGNFFFFFLTSPLIFSFLECFLGLVIIMFGLLFYVSIFLHNIESFINSIGFLSFFSTPIMNYFYSLFPFRFDYTWFESLGGKGVLIFLLFMYYKSLIIFFLSFSFFVIFIFLFSFYFLLP